MFFVSVPANIDQIVRKAVCTSFPNLTHNELMYSIKFESTEPYTGKIYFHSNGRDDEIIGFSIDTAGMVTITN